MSQREDDVAAYQQQTANLPAGTEDRVWRRLQATTARPVPSSAARWRWALALGVVAAAAGVALVVRPAPSALEPQPVEVATRGEHFVVQGRATLRRTEPNRFELSSGAVAVSSWSPPGPGTPLTVTVRGHEVTAQRAVFALEVAGDSVVVDVREGTVLVDGVAVTKRWPASAPAIESVAHFEPLPEAQTSAAVPAKVAPVEPAEGPKLTQPHEIRSVLAPRVGRSGEAAAVTAPSVPGPGQGEHQVGSAETPPMPRGPSELGEEGMLLQRADHELRALSDPTAALRTLNETSRRFPHGSLRQEVALTRLEALRVLRDWPAVRSAASDFLAEYPDSERRAEVERLGQFAAQQ